MGLLSSFHLLFTTANNRDNRNEELYCQSEKSDDLENLVGSILIANATALSHIWNDVWRGKSHLITQLCPQHDVCDLYSDDRLLSLYEALLPRVDWTIHYDWRNSVPVQ